MCPEVGWNILDVEISHTARTLSRVFVLRVVFRIGLFVASVTRGNQFIWSIAQDPIIPIYSNINQTISAFYRFVRLKQKHMFQLLFLKHSVMVGFIDKKPCSEVVTSKLMMTCSRCDLFFLYLN